jgi:hypothetical protein
MARRPFQIALLNHTYNYRSNHKHMEGVEGVDQEGVNQEGGWRV